MVGQIPGAPGGPGQVEPGVCHCQTHGELPPGGAAQVPLQGRQELEK